MEEKKAKLKQKREEMERKARRGEIDPMHEHAFQVISHVSKNDKNQPLAKDWLK